MADYLSIIARAVGTLEPNTAPARRRLYERARVALRSEMQGADPPFQRSEITAAQMALEAAIEKVEGQQPRDRVPSEPAAMEHPAESVRWAPIATAPPVESVRAPPVAVARPGPRRRVPAASQPANQNDAKPASRTGAWAQYLWRLSPSVDIDEPDHLPQDRGTWLSEVLERASLEADNDEQDFAPKRARSSGAAS
jgi:hypothetical protein